YQEAFKKLREGFHGSPRLMLGRTTKSSVLATHGINRSNLSAPHSFSPGISRAQPLVIFSSIDLYSSITTIPYTLKGFLDNNPVFTVSGIVPNTFGNFATVLNPYSAVQIDALEVTLTDSTPPCC